MAPALWLILFALALRAPFFTVDVIDWDESTFILMGDAWANGALPYTALWDNKPPLCFAPFALTQLLFGKSIVAMRLLGAGTVAIAGIAMLHVGRRLRSERLGFIAGLSTIVLATFASRGQATMSETLAIAPLALASIPFLTDRLSVRSVFLSGVGLSVAALIRFNLALVAVALVLWLVVTERQRLRLALACAFGGAVPLLIVTSLYVAAGEARTFWISVFVAPFAYALQGLALAQLSSSAPVLSLTPLLRPSGPPPVFWVLVLATALSIVGSGGGSAHYWIQIHPFSGLLAAFLLDATARWLPRGSAWAFLTLVPFAGWLSDTPWHRLGTPSRTRQVVAYLEEQGARSAPTFFLSEHLAHWWLDTAPLHPMATHPSNLFRPELIRAVLGPGETPTGVLRAILQQAPLYIVRERYVRRLGEHPAARELLERTLAEDYRLETELSGLSLYRRR